MGLNYRRDVASAAAPRDGRASGKQANVFFFSFGLIRLDETVACVGVASDASNGIQSAPAVLSGHPHAWPSCDTSYRTTVTLHIAHTTQSAREETTMVLLSGLTFSVEQMVRC